ncbi:hypothetical protein KEM55_008206, partial [Ascosphaera atra]
MGPAVPLSASATNDNDDNNGVRQGDSSVSSTTIPTRQKSHSITQRPNNPYRHRKRPTLHFPIALPDNATQQQSQTNRENGDSAENDMFLLKLKKTRAADTPLAETPSIDEDTGDGPVVQDGGSFLTAIAAQERKVLELKEELQKAEAELTSLKIKWKEAEDKKQQSEILFQKEALKSMRRASLASSSTEMRNGRGSLDEQQQKYGSPVALREQQPQHAQQQKRDSRELERRGSTVTRHSVSLSTTSNGSAPAKPRTVFQGSKHTRTLSLLANNQ